MLEVGIFLGGVLTGNISDKIGKKAVLMIPETWIAAFLIFSVKQWIN